MDNSFDNIDPFADDDEDTQSGEGTIVSLADEDDEDDTLTNEEKKKVLDSWNSGEKSLKNLIKAAVGDGVDGRSKKGIAVKKYLSALSYKAVPAQTYQKKTDAFALSDSNKEYIRAHSATSRPLELTREIFNNQSLTNLSTEARAVTAFYNTLDPNLRFVKDVAEDTAPQEYRPPKTHAHAIARVNRYVLNGIDPNKITQKEELMMTALIRHLHVHRLIYMMNEFNSVRDRELFESSFIRFIYDKPDLTEEDLDSYMNLCADIVNHTAMQRNLEVLKETQENCIATDGKIPMAVVEAISNCYTAMDGNLKRQKGVLESLQTKRSERLKSRIKENASVVQLVDLWKDEIKRQQFIKLADVRKQKLKDEVNNLETMDELRFQLWGVGKNEIVDY